jgi:hypothetical protein
VPGCFDQPTWAAATKLVDDFYRRSNGPDDKGHEIAVKKVAVELEDKGRDAARRLARAIGAERGTVSQGQAAFAPAYFGSEPAPDHRRDQEPDHQLDREPDQVIPWAVRQWAQDHSWPVGPVEVAFPPFVATSLRQRLAAEVSPAERSREETEAQLELLTSDWLRDHLVGLRSENGEQIDLTLGGRSATVWLRLQMAAPTPSLQPAAPVTDDTGPLPAVKSLKDLTTAAEFRDSVQTGNYRTVPIAFSPSWILPASLPGTNWIDIVGFYPSLTVTHHQQTISVATSGTLEHAVALLGEVEAANAFDFEPEWQFRVEQQAPEAEFTENGGWSGISPVGTVRVVIPGYLTGAPAGDAVPPPAGSLDDALTWKAEFIHEGLYDGIRDRFSNELENLSDSSWNLIREFTEELELLSNMALMIDDAYLSRTLYDKTNKVIGALRIKAEVQDFSPAGESRIPLRRSVIRGVRAEGSHAVRNHSSLSIPVGVTLSADHEVGHPNDMLHPSSVWTPRVGGTWGSTSTLEGSDVATVARTLTSTGRHPLVWADVRYLVTLVGPGRQDPAPEPLALVFHAA